MNMPLSRVLCLWSVACAALLLAVAGCARGPGPHAAGTGVAGGPRRSDEGKPRLKVRITQTGGPVSPQGDWDSSEAMSHVAIQLPNKDGYESIEANSYPGKEFRRPGAAPDHTGPRPIVLVSVSRSPGELGARKQKVVVEIPPGVGEEIEVWVKRPGKDEKLCAGQ